MKVQADPFVKVKELIQKLIERLVHESTQEATKKGFCDLELSKAEKNRNHRWADVQRLNAELASLEAKQDSLEEELGELSDALTQLNSNLEEATELRTESKDENLQTLKDAKEGLEAVSEALLVLKVFYKRAAKAKVLLQASPVDEDDPGAEAGAYKGAQQKSNAVIGLLEVIVSDYERTIKNTSAEEEKEAAELLNMIALPRLTLVARRQRPSWMSRIWKQPKPPSRKRLRICKVTWILLTKHSRNLKSSSPCALTQVCRTKSVWRRERRKFRLLQH